MCNPDTYKYVDFNLYVRTVVFYVRTMDFKHLSLEFFKYPAHDRGWKNNLQSANVINFTLTILNRRQNV